MIFFFLFIVLPAVELALLIEIGQRIGTFETLALIVITGMLGASLARHQGLRVLEQVQVETQQGRIPGEALTDGVIILLAAALLITPGVVTDAVGFLCLIPLTRRLVKSVVWRWFERKVRSGQAQMYVYTDRSQPQPPTQPRDIEAEYEVVDNDENTNPQSETRNSKQSRNSKNE